MHSTVVNPCGLLLSAVLIDGVMSSSALSERGNQLTLFEPDSIKAVTLRPPCGEARYPSESIDVCEDSGAPLSGSF